jgi:hypothetical protein
MYAYITSQPLRQRNGALGVVCLRNSRAHLSELCCFGRLDGPQPLIARGLSRNLLRPELISASPDKELI